MKKYLAFFLFLGILLPQISSAYNPQTTHAGLTEQTAEFYNLNSRLPLFKNNNKEKSLCTWTSKQRKKYNDKTLNNNYINKLNNLTWWNWDISIETKWHNKYNEVIKYIETNNKFPSHSKNNNKLERELGLWISKQKLAYKETNLLEDKIKKLEKIIGLGKKILIIYGMNH